MKNIRDVFISAFLALLFAPLSVLPTVSAVRQKGLSEADMSPLHAHVCRSSHRTKPLPAPLRLKNHRQKIKTRPGLFARAEQCSPLLWSRKMRGFYSILTAFDVDFRNREAQPDIAQQRRRPGGQLQFQAVPDRP